METIQPLEEIMNRLGLTSADLVNASTEQLTFKMVQKGRRGRRLTPNVQEKILNALLAAKPGYEFRRRDMFRYPMEPSRVEHIRESLRLVRSKKISYPEFVSRLAEGGVTGYFADVGPNRVTFFGIGGEAHVEAGEMISSGAPGPFNEAGIRSAIGDAQKSKIDHPAFLRRIHESGVSGYDVNTRKRKIKYLGAASVYAETIPDPSAAPLSAAAAEPAPPKKSGKAKAKPKKTSVVRKGRKVIKKHRVKKGRRR